jgi:hypothetical protein
MFKKLSLASLFFGSLLLAGSGCDEAKQEIDCGNICNRYEECTSDDYDVSACIDRCDEKLDSDSDRAEECADCIDDRSCTGAVFNCAAECAGIVP